MQLHVQTTIFMICMAYLVLHGAIWFALSEQRNFQVRLWCISGLISGVSVILLSLREAVGELTFVYLAQLLMLIGNMGRTIAMRMYLNDSILAAVGWHSLAAIMYFVWFTAAYEAGTPDAALSVMFFGFYTIVCFDYFLVGLLLHRRAQTLGPRVLMLGGLVLCVSLGVKAALTALGMGTDDIYGAGVDQAIMIAGQFIAITLLNIGFLRIFLELREQRTLQTERSLAAAEERATLLTQHQAELRSLVTEREEIIRQLTLINKTAGMGALVASLAHELNQPLCAIRLNAQLVERKLDESQADLPGARRFLDSVIADNRRAANIITKLRTLFDHQNRGNRPVDLSALVRDTVSLVQLRANAEGVTLVLELDAAPVIQGDQTQLQQVILNLLNNALDALSGVQRPQPTVRISGQATDQRFRLRVEDNGAGIPEGVRESIFELFKTTKASGMGIGLWLSKAVIQAHRGDIVCAHTSSSGTCFEVLLPLR